MILADTGALYALVDASDSWHARVVEWWPTASSPIVVPVTVLPEVTYLLHHRIGMQAEQAFVESVASGEFPIEPLEGEDVSRAAEVMREYSDLDIGFVDATIVAIAERIGADEIATTDRRHFSMIRPRHRRSFKLLPQ